MASLPVRCDQNATFSVLKLLASASGTKVMGRACWLAASTYTVSKPLTACNFDACLIEFAQDDRDVLKAARRSVHGGSVCRHRPRCGVARPGSSAWVTGWGPDTKPSRLGSCWAAIQD